MALDLGECWFDVRVLFAGLTVPTPIDLSPDVRLEPILDWNLVATLAKMASEVVLQLPSDPDVPRNPVCGLNYRVRGKRLIASPPERVGEDSRFNDRQIDAPRRAFIRAVSLLRGMELGDAGTFVREVDSAGTPHLRSSQFNYGRLSVHYDAAYFGEEHAVELRALFGNVSDPYLSGDGASIAVAIDRLGAAALRLSPLDVNLDLCIAAEIAFRFGTPNRRKISATIRKNARCFFGDEELAQWWDRGTIHNILRDSYDQRSDTVHGNKGPDLERNDVLAGLNAQLRVILQASLRAYVERKPTQARAREAWIARRTALARRRPLGPIFTTPTK